MRKYSDRAARIRAEFRIRRTVRAVGGALAVGAVVAGGGLTALPASAAPATPTVRVVTGDRMLTASWSAVAGAASYTVRVGSTRSLAKARVVTTTDRTVSLRAVKNRTAYYVGVTADVPGLINPATARSRVVEAVPGSGLPYPVTQVKATMGAEPNQIRVDWSGGGRAQKVAVVAGSSVITHERSFNSGWYPATTRSITLTVPEQYRSFLGAGTGTPIWVKVVQSNSASAVFGPSYSASRQYRVSPTGTWSFARRAAAPDVPVTRLRVAEYNTQSIGASAKHSVANRWPARVDRVAKNVNAADPDLLLTAELSTSLVRSCSNSIARNTYCTSAAQYMNLANDLDGLEVAGRDAYQRVIEMMRRYPRWAGDVTNGAHVFFDPKKLTLLDHGYFSPALTPEQSFENVVGLGVSGWTGREIGPDRWLSWAKLRTVEGREFFAVAAHFPTGDGAAASRLRGEEAQKVVAAIDRLAGDLPVVFGGDLNTDSVRSPHAGQPQFIAAGWFDAAAVASKGLRDGMRVSTANGSGAQDGKDGGYGSKPVVHPYETSRIDYILLKNSPYTYSYKNLVRVDGSGRFDRSVQGSDHNMQLAEVGIAGPTG